MGTQDPHTAGGAPSVRSLLIKEQEHSPLFILLSLPIERQKALSHHLWKTPYSKGHFIIRLVIKRVLQGHLGAGEKILIVLFRWVPKTVVVESSSYFQMFSERGSPNRPLIASYQAFSLHYYYHYWLALPQANWLSSALETLENFRERETFGSIQDMPHLIIVSIEQTSLSHVSI